MDYVWHQHQQAAAVAAAKTPGFPFSPYALPWLAKRGPVLFPGESIKKFMKFYEIYVRLELVKRVLPRFSYLLMSCAEFLSSLGIDLKRGLK